MIIAVEGTKTFSDYDTFMRAMGVALSQENNEPVIEVWSAGPHKVNSFTAAFCNSSENFLRQKGFRIVFKKVTPDFISSHIDNVDYLAFFSKKNEPVSRLTASAELHGTEIGIFRT